MIAVRNRVYLLRASVCYCVEPRRSRALRGCDAYINVEGNIYYPRAYVVTAGATVEDERERVWLNTIY